MIEQHQQRAMPAPAAHLAKPKTISSWVQAILHTFEAEGLDTQALVEQAGSAAKRPQRSHRNGHHDQALDTGTKSQ